MDASQEIGSGQLFGFSLPDRHARGRVVRLDRVLDEILSAHDYPPAITHLLAEALILTALIGGLLKQDSGQMTMQAQTEGGVVGLLVCDFRDGELRGYVDFDADRLASLGANPSLYALFGKGYLAITFDMVDGAIGSAGRYQGIVPLEGETLAAACETYFAQSEQVPTLIRVAAKVSRGRCTAAGLLIQHLAESEEGRERLSARPDLPEWEHVVALAGSIRHDELLDPQLSMEAIVWRLFHEEREVRVRPGPAIARGCRCSAEHYAEIIARFPEEDRADMRNEAGEILVDCAFCSRIFPIAG